jgi:hypothetical protein
MGAAGEWREKMHSTIPGECGKHSRHCRWQALGRDRRGFAHCWGECYLTWCAEAALDLMQIINRAIKVCWAGDCLSVGLSVPQFAGSAGNGRHGQFLTLLWQ